LQASGGIYILLEGDRMNFRERRSRNQNQDTKRESQEPRSLCCKIPRAAENYNTPFARAISNRVP
jgi:hypothetical protein